MIRTALLSLLVLLSTPAFAIYKCEKNGTVSYSDEACPGGTTFTPQTAPAGDSGAAKRQLAHEEKELKQLERERHKQESEQEREAKQVARAQSAKQRKCSNLARRTKWAHEDATGKSAEKVKRKARRAEEQYDAECRA